MHQRARMYGGMIRSVAQQGYKATTVTDVVELAGISRGTFYEQFSSKEACFLGTYDIVIARSHKLIREAWRNERGWTNRMRASWKALLHDIAGDPTGPHLVLVDALGIGLKGRERMRLADSMFERLVTAGFRAEPDGGTLPPFIAPAVVAGARHTVFNRMLEQRERELYSLTDEVLDWSFSYRSPSLARLASGLSTPPPVARVPAAFLRRDDRRARLLGSIVHLTLDEGYANLTDSQIAEFAGVSTRAFHMHFSGKEECFLAVLDEFAAEARESVRPELERASSWPESVYHATVAFAAYLTSHRALLKIAFVDLFEVGPGMVGRLNKVVEEFISLITESSPEPRHGPVLAREAITGAVWGMVFSHVTNDRAARLPCLVEQLTFIALAPYLGPEDAIGAIVEAR